MLGYQPTVPTVPNVIGRLRVRAGGRDSLLTQQRIGRLLDPIELRPRQLPSSAILYIRTLRDPLPGALRLANGDVRPSPAWQEALSATLERLASNAVRPAREAVPPSAEAVVFSDRSEMLACLAGDWCEGSVMSRWWWQSLLKQGAATQIVKELWRRDPEYVPAALQQLASKNKATDFVRAWSDAEARELLRGVAQSFALPTIIRVLETFETPVNADHNSLNLVRGKTVSSRASDLVSVTAAPWRPWVPECRGAELQPEQEFFLGVALMLQRAPLKARAPEFQVRVREWQQEISLARAGKSMRASSTLGQPATADHRPRNSKNLDKQPLHSSADHPQNALRAGWQMHETAGARRDVNDTDREPSEAGSASSSAAVPEACEIVKADQITQPVHAQPADGELRSQTSRPTEESVRRAPARAKLRPATTTKTDARAGDSPVERKTVSGPAAESIEPPRTPGDAPFAAGDASPSASEEVLQPLFDETPAELSATASAESEAEEWIETRFGGVFYLINLGLALGLYGDFTTPDEPGIQLSIWDFVALLACELAGDDVRSDPVWLLLGQLAQREEGELLGAGFEPEAVPSFEFRVSSFEFDKARNLKPEPEQQHPEPETQNAKLKTRNSKLETGPAVVAWLDRLMPFARRRLRQALGLSEGDAPGPLVCRQRARVCLTPTHLDVFFFLAELPIEIRLAGLDRNPGWVPAAGRFIAFHFD